MLSVLLRAGSLLAALSLLTFAIAEWTPGDYLTALRLNPDLSGPALEAMRQRLGLEEPWAVRYARWCGSVARGDFGTSLAYGVPVRSLLEGRLPATLWLNALSTLAAWTIALGAGARAARREGGWIDRGTGLTAALLAGFPELLLALAGLWWFGGRPELPYAVLALGALPVLLPHARAALRDALAVPAVTAARLHGILGPRLWSRYVLPAAAPPLLSLAGVSLGGLLSASLLVEAALDVPGLGSLLLDAIQARDTAVVAAVTALSGALLVLANLGADLARRTLDPRLRRRTS